MGVDTYAVVLVAAEQVNNYYLKKNFEKGDFISHFFLRFQGECLPDPFAEDICNTNTTLSLQITVPLEIIKNKNVFCKRVLFLPHKKTFFPLIPSHYN